MISLCVSSLSECTCHICANASKTYKCAGNLVKALICIHNLCMRAAKALAWLCVLADSPKPLLLSNARSVKISCIDPYQH